MHIYDHATPSMCRDETTSSALVPELECRVLLWFLPLCEFWIYLLFKISYEMESRKSLLGFVILVTIAFPYYTNGKI